MKQAPNKQTFILFRVLFNCRLYYPIFTVLFLDYGITLEEFSLLNVIWAISIVIFEVPSGALADIVGRRRFVIFSAFLMILEMLILLLAPRYSSSVFWILLINRILSGLAEACASGADEALTYDSLQSSDKDKEWATLIKTSMTYQSIGMLITMLLGAFLYDWSLLTKIIPALGTHFTKDWGLRIPIAINLLLAVYCFRTALQFQEVENPKETNTNSLTSKILDSFSQIKLVAIQIFKSHSIFSLIIFGFILDSTLRMFVTLTTKYYRELNVSESFFGILGATMALVGTVSSNWAHSFVLKFDRKTNFTILYVVTASCFLAMLSIHNYFGLALVVILSLCMYFLGYFMSYYLNREAKSDIRATLLSFKGLSFNLAYAFAGIIYAQVAKASSDNFSETLPFFYKYLTILLICGLILNYFHKARNYNKLTP